MRFNKKIEEQKAEIEEIKLKVNNFLDDLLSKEWHKENGLKEESFEDFVAEREARLEDKAISDVCWICKRSRKEVMQDLLFSMFADFGSEYSFEEFVKNKEELKRFKEFSDFPDGFHSDDNFIGANTSISLCSVCKSLISYISIDKIRNFAEKVDELADKLVHKDNYSDDFEEDEEKDT